uniref:Klotho beta n=1 Tax=Denticeps clupeoides TaxID=299321 RepID=A0AAY4EF54_9TELE
MAKYFLWGVGTSAHQTEGSWNQDGKGPSIWDHFTHTRGSSTADTASDSYVRWNEDVEAVAYLGTHFYAFSLSWPRLFPNGTGSPNGFINQVLQVYDSVPVFGYTAWSLVDGFEWNFGYTMRTGLFHVDFNSTGRNRAPKTTAKFYKSLAHLRYSISPPIWGPGLFCTACQLGRASKPLCKVP